MTIQSIQAPVTIEWDDSVVIVFSFVTPGGQKTFSGFNHQIPSAQSVVGQQTQVTNILQIIQQQGLQVTADPQTWVETLKNSHRNQNNFVSIVFEDAVSLVYTTQTNQSFTLQPLFSLAG
jgi:hypothetical protein